MREKEEWEGRDKKLGEKYKRVNNCKSDEREEKVKEGWHIKQ